MNILDLKLIIVGNACDVSGERNVTRKSDLDNQCKNCTDKPLKHRRHWHSITLKSSHCRTVHFKSTPYLIAPGQVSGKCYNMPARSACFYLTHCFGKVQTMKRDVSSRKRDIILGGKYFSGFAQSADPCWDFSRDQLFK